MASPTLPLHMHIRPLIIEDSDQVIALESKGFPPHERASEKTIEYRLLTCPELCSGLFIRELDSNGKDIKDEKLIGHVMGTKIKGSFITLSSMQAGSHVEGSSTIAIHSLVIDPEYQKKNLATLLLTDYIQKLSNQEVGNRIVIIAHEHLIPFYERIGFKVIAENKEVTKDPDFSNTKWIDMERELVKEEYDS